MKAWWFGPDDKLPNGDGRPIVIGETHEVTGEIIPCKHGLHGSKRIIDALGYAKRATIYRVELGGALVEHVGDKFAASRRTYLWKIDGTEVLRKFARQCALDVIHLWKAPEVVVRFLKTGENAEAAWSAAVAERAAMRAAAAARASGAAERAAERAAKAATAARPTWAAVAARVAAQAAADAEAAGVTVRAAAARVAAVTKTVTRNKQNRRLTRMVLEEHRRQGN